jgi:hypothetical protein
MTFQTTDNKKLKIIRIAVILGVIVAASLLVASRSHARLCSHARLDRFLAHVQERGGSLVRCKEGECEDVRTGAYFGRKPDGLYLVYPDGTMDAEELQEQRAYLQQLMRDEERGCGVN